MGMYNERLLKLWDSYAQAGYEKADLTHSTKDLRRKIHQLILDSQKGTFLDAGCGTGGNFETIIKKGKPTKVYAVDWSKEMLAKAETEAEKYRHVHFEFHQIDLSEPLFWHDSTFDGVISSLVVCYLQGGWQLPLKELCRVIKPGGYLYLATFHSEWKISSAVRKYAPRELFQSRSLEKLKGLVYGIRFRKIAAEICEEGKRYGADFPCQDELMHFLEALRFEKIEKIPIYFGCGLALRARKM